MAAIKKTFVLILLIFTLTGCASSLFKSFPLQTETPIVKKDYVKFVKVGDIQIADVGKTKTETNLKQQLATALKRYPRITTTYLTDVWLVESADKSGDVLGKYVYREKAIYISINGYSDREIIDTFYHELGHAIHLSMTVKAEDAWYALFLKRLKVLGYKKSLGKDWRTVKDIKGFPSYYSLKSFWEYFAEHFRVSSMRSEHHKKMFKPEHKLLLKHKLLPVKKIKKIKNEKTKRKKSYCRAA